MCDSCTVDANSCLPDTHEYHFWEANITGDGEGANFEYIRRVDNIKDGKGNMIEANSARIWNIAKQKYEDQMFGDAG